MMRRDPLLRMAAIGGVAYMGAKAAGNRGQKQQAQQAQQVPAPAAQASAASDRITQLQELASLHDSGALTDEEFASEKAKVLG